MEKPSKHEEKRAREYVKNWNNNNLLGKNTKLTEEWYIQARLWDKLRVVFTSTKEVIRIFRKENHKSHR